VDSFARELIFRKHTKQLLKSSIKFYIDHRFQDFWRSWRHNRDESQRGEGN